MIPSPVATVYQPLTRTPVELVAATPLAEGDWALVNISYSDPQAGFAARMHEAEAAVANAALGAGKANPGVPLRYDEYVYVTVESDTTLYVWTEGSPCTIAILVQ